MYELRHPELEDTITVRTPGQVRAYATAGWGLVGEHVDAAQADVDHIASIARTPLDAFMPSAEADTPNPLTED